MLSRLRKPTLSLGLVLLAALALAACGNSETKVTTGTYAGESGQNAPYLNVGPLVYEVQLSRELNPANVEDAAYLQGLTPLQRRLAPGQEWFAVFIQVYNHSSVAHLGASTITISDTQSNVYTPIVPDQTNQFAYRGGFIPASSQIPVASSIAANGGTQGALLLYKIRVVSLDNRPLTIHIVDPLDATQRASAELDV
ncbi:MAG TPA: hypothetical protein VG053_10780 [Solirubrobacteraceae bacterium]|nr:hypothetical protein [Solirubrobacteraceae bacterium]